jgi:hypothetical protein
MIDDDECEAVGGMRNGRGNPSSRRKPVPMPLCPPQMPHVLSLNEPGLPLSEASDSTHFYVFVRMETSLCVIHAQYIPAPGIPCLSNLVVQLQTPPVIQINSNLGSIINIARDIYWYIPVSYKHVGENKGKYGKKKSIRRTKR